MANVTPFELLCPMFKNPRTSSLRVTFVADVGVEFIDLSQTRSCSTPMGCMTVGASQCPLDDPMVVGKIKVGLDVSMAGETEIRILFLQEVFGGLLCMNLMAVITPNSTKLMDPSSKLEKCFLFLMALQTDIRAVFCIFAFKREEEPFTFCLRMLCSWTMAGFAFSYPMGIFLKKIINVGMALFAGLRPYISLLLRLHLLLAK
ncbi:MAG: hypothetical protein ABSH06_15745 [Thermodesulfobacteriota bacterium]